MHFSTWIKKHIKIANITQQELATALQRSPGTVSNWTADRYTPEEPETILTIAQIFTPAYNGIGECLLSLMLSLQYTKQNPPKTKDLE